MDFDRAASRLKKEQEKRRAEAVKRIEREKKAQEEAARQQAIIAEAIQERKRQQAAAEEAARAAAEEERRLTAGIAYEEELLALEADGEGDKLTLPPSALDQLTKQDALAQGPMLFRVTRRGMDGKTVVRTTHAGVLEFSAAEGTCGLPLKVQRSLGLRGEEGQADDAPLGSVTVKYVRLEKGTYAKIQPRTSGLSQVPELKAMLEMNLHNHATLSQGDLLQVWYRGKPFDLRVVELQPAAQVTVIDTDIEVDLDVPEDYQQQQAAQAAQAAAQARAAPTSPTGSGASSSSRAGGTPPRPAAGAGGGVTLGGGGGGKMLGGSASSSSSSSASPPPPPAPSAGGDALQGEGEERRRAELLASLPPEPAADVEGAIGLQIRRPDGKVVARRFLLSAPFAHVFAFVDATGGEAGAGAGAGYRLVTRFPRRVFTAEGTAGRTLAEAGLSGRQEQLLFERGV